MQVVLTFLLLIGLALDVAHKCDSYFVGNVHYRRRGHGVDTDDVTAVQGCKKGCFWNETYTDDGVPKCEKCSAITDETKCLGNTATCRWAKKCKSQSCPSIAKARATLYGADPNFAVNDNTTLESQYRNQVRKEKECIEGSALEQKYNNQLWNDFSASNNYQYAVWNVDDTCTDPGSSVGTQDSGLGTYSWANVRTDNATANKDACNKFWGYNYTAFVSDPPIPATDALQDECTPNDCASILAGVASPTPTLNKAACENVAGCIYIKGKEDTAPAGSDDICEFATGTSCTRSTVLGTARWESGKNNANECNETKGCMYVRGVGGSDPSGDRNDYRDMNGLSTTDRCVPGCGTTFVAGTGTRKDCEILGCTYDGGDLEADMNRDERPGNNLKTFEDFDLCPADRHPPTRPVGAPTICGFNQTLALGYIGDDDDAPCYDRIYDDMNPFSCNITALTTEESCKSGHGIWTPPPKTCRYLLSTIRSLCEFSARDNKNEIVYANLSRHGGNRRPGTAYEKCVQDHYDLTDIFKTENVTGYDGEIRVLPAFLTLEDHERIYGYRTPEEYCQHQLDLKVKACQEGYDASVVDCHTRVVINEVTANDWTRTPIQVKASRSACHRIYGCMYSKMNERCSVWAVWAFIFTIVLSVVVFIIILGVGAIVLVPILKKSLA